ncbi:MAG: hypothetical protein QXP97_00255 [Desulfurococcus sp.]|jgi:hypothetical protein|uniref:hypothetical protein n=1 Tax=Desulfurococcus sp. TaxID=51678 RepID=UPI00316165D1
MEVYLELRGNRWIRVTGRLKQVVVSKGRKSLRYVLVGETIDKPPSTESWYSMKVPTGGLNKLILKLIEENKGHIVVFEKSEDSEYVAKTESMEALELVRKTIRDVLVAKGRTMQRDYGLGEESLKQSNADGKEEG